MMKKRNKTNKFKKVIFGFLAFFIFSAVVAMPTSAVIVYEAIFSQRFEPLDEMSFEVEDFSELIQEKCFFESSEGKRLAGFKYDRRDNDEKAVVVISHGLGGGGQSLYMDVADFFTKNDFYVFSYDATGNGDSQGDDVRGLPQGVMDLDKALDFVKKQPEYAGLPIVIFGHSWGAYSTGSVLEYHPDISAVVMVAGFNQSKNMLEQESVKAVGPIARLTLPYVNLYEYFKFGDYSQASAMKGFDASDAGVMILQSKDDTDVLPEIGYDIFYDKYSSSPRFRFVLFEDRGHSYLYYKNGDIELGLDENLMNEIVDFYILYCEK